MDRKIIDYLPPVLRRVREIGAIMDAEQPEIESIWISIDGALNDQFIADATENGVKRWEKILKITPKAADDLDVRRFRILTRLMEQTPHTLATLKQQLAALCGAEHYTVTVEGYTLTVKLGIAARGKFDEVVELLHRVVPANMTITVTIKYNRHSAFIPYTHAQLSTHTHDGLRNADVGAES